MRRQVAKARFAPLTSRTTWRRLAQGVAILLLLTHQAWAGVVCICQHNDGLQQAAQMAHVCSAARHHSDVRAEHTGEVADSSAAYSEEGAPGTDDRCSGNQSCTLLQGAMVCCPDVPQAEQNATISLQKPAPVISNRSLVSIKGQSVPVFIHYNFHQLYRTQPLYLSFSCFLI